MAEYIEREAAETELTYAMCGTGYQGRAIDAVRFIPSADVEEVRHGEWIETEFYNNFHAPLYRCSVCRREVGDHYMFAHKYCLHCGAKMDGKGEG